MYVLMVVPSNFPNGDAGAVRDMAFAKIYQELGYEVFLIGAGRGEKVGVYQEVHYYSLYKEVKSITDHFIKFVSATRTYMKLVNGIIKNNGVPSVIHINSVPEAVIRNLIKIAERRNIPILHDSTEWLFLVESVLHKKCSLELALVCI